MRDEDEQIGALFSYLRPEGLRDYPLRSIRPSVNTALENLSAKFETVYVPGGQSAPVQAYRGTIRLGSIAATGLRKAHHRGLASVG